MLNANDYIKWALFLAAIVSIIAILASGISVLTDVRISEGISSVLSSALPYIVEPIRDARGFLNNICGSPIPIDVALYSVLILPFIKLSAYVLQTIYSWIFKS